MVKNRVSKILLVYKTKSEISYNQTSEPNTREITS